RVDGQLRRVSRAGAVGDPAGVLEDYAHVAAGWLALHQATGDGEWLRAAGGLLDVAVARFADGQGGCYDTAAAAERFVRRPADPTARPPPVSRRCVTPWSPTPRCPASRRTARPPSGRWPRWP